MHDIIVIGLLQIHVPVFERLRHLALVADVVNDALPIAGRDLKCISFLDSVLHS